MAATSSDTEEFAESLYVTVRVITEGVCRAPSSAARAMPTHPDQRAIISAQRYSLR
jgi:hypothetical protein